MNKRPEMTYDIKTGGARQVSRTTKVMGLVIVFGVLLLVVGLVRAAAQNPVPAVASTPSASIVSSTPIPTSTLTPSPTQAPKPTPVPKADPNRVQAVAAKALTAWGIRDPKARAAALATVCEPGIITSLAAHPATVQDTGKASVQVTGNGTTAVVTQPARGHTYQVHLSGQGRDWRVTSILGH